MRFLNESDVEAPTGAKAIERVLGLAAERKDGILFEAREKSPDHRDDVSMEGSIMNRLIGIRRDMKKHYERFLFFISQPRMRLVMHSRNGTCAFRESATSRIF